VVRALRCRRVLRGVVSPIYPRCMVIKRIASIIRIPHGKAG